MSYFKDLDIEIRELDFKGFSPEKIANTVGLSVNQVIEILNIDFNDADIMDYANDAADLDAEHYGRV